MRVSRAFAFLDLSGFTSLTAVHGDELAVSLLTAFRAVVREVCSRRGVRIAKWLGDGAMLVGVEVPPVISTALEIESRLDTTASPLAIRAGISCGDVILFEGDDYVGHAVNLAARICDVAGPHEVLATPDVVVHAPPWVSPRDAGERAVRGLVHPVPLVELSVCATRTARVIDPVCHMELPAEGVVVSLRGPKGEKVGFCSESCADTWAGRWRDEAQQRDPLDGTVT